jgi:hypothetical protein
LVIVNVGLFHGHLVFISIFWYIFWSFGILLPFFGIYFGHLVFLLPFWFVQPRKVWQYCYIPKGQFTPTMKSCRAMSRDQIRSNPICVLPVEQRHATR